MTASSETNSSTDLLIQARRWAERGYQYQRRHEYAKAIICYSEAIQLLPRLENVHTCRGTCQFQLNDYTAAISDFSVELTVNPNNLPLYRKRALAYIKLAQFASAIADFEYVRHASPVVWNESCRLPHASALYHFGVSESQQGNLDAAIEYLAESVRLAPEAATGIKPQLLALHQRRAVRDREQEEKVQVTRQEEARRQSQLEAQRQREYAARHQAEIEAYVHNNRAIQYMDQGQYDLALTKFNEALRYDPTLIDALVNRAQVLYIKAQQMISSPPPRSDSNLYRVHLMHLQRSLRTALDSYNQALQLGLELIQIHSARSATRRALLDVEHEIEQMAHEHSGEEDSHRPPDGDTDQVMF